MNVLLNGPGELPKLTLKFLKYPRDDQQVMQLCRMTLPHFYAANIEFNSPNKSFIVEMGGYDCIGTFI